MKYAGLIAKLTLEEKAGLTSGLDFWHTKAVKRLGIPSEMMTDGPHGLRRQESDSDALGLGRSVPATCFPTASALANTWDESLLSDVGRAIGEEAVAQGVGMVLGPGVNIKRSPLCGRNFEYFSEDPLLSGKLAAAMIRGIQSTGVSACVKHFAANSQELRRMATDSVMDERTLREIYLPAFETAVKEGGVRSLMTAYNRLNGTYCNENGHLLREILRGEWGFDGLVVSDWGGNNDRVEAVRAGSSLEMPASNGETDRHIVEAVRNGTLDEALLDEQVDHVLDFVFSAQKTLAHGGVSDGTAHHALAAKAAAESAVLLKNEKEFLPLRRFESVAVIGDFAAVPRYQGAGSSHVNPTRLDAPLDALRAAGVNIVGYEKGFLRSGAAAPRLLRRAKELAARSEKVLLFLGLDEGSETEGYDRGHMRLRENQLDLLREIAEINPNVGVVLQCGSPVEMTWDVFSRAVLHLFLGGQAVGMACAALLTGEANPCGKLAETMPVRLEDTPCAPWYPGREATSEYREGLFVGYRYYESAHKRVKYPFGYGLSYTEFSYAPGEFSPGGVSFTVKNTGSRAGAEVAQLYVRSKTHGMLRPALSLAGFARVELLPGEEKTVFIPLGERSFAVWSRAKNRWVVEEGEYELCVGASCRDLRLVRTVHVAGEAPLDEYAAPEFDVYRRADVHHVSDGSFAALLGHDIPPARWNDRGAVDFNDAISRGKYLPGGLGKVLYTALEAARRVMNLVGSRENAGSLMYVLDMPWRNAARMANVFSDDQIKALLKIVNKEKNGWKHFLAETKKKRAHKRA